MGGNIRSGSTGAQGFEGGDVMREQRCEQRGAQPAADALAREQEADALSVGRGDGGAAEGKQLAYTLVDAGC